MNIFLRTHREERPGQALQTAQPPRTQAVTGRGSPVEQAADLLADRALAVADRLGAAGWRQPAERSARHPEERPSSAAGVVPESPGRPLPAPIRVEMESAFGHDFRGVRLHSGQEAARMARALGARAYTYGRDVVVGRGEPVHGPAGRQLLAHELAHVVQHDASGHSVVARQEKPGPDGRTDSGIRSELERLTGKSFAELVLRLGRGPIVITPRELEAELVRNGTLRRPEMDTSEPVVIDEVLVPDPYRDAFVTEGRVGRASQVDRAKKAGQQAVRDAFLSGMAGGLSGTRTGAASQGLVKSAPVTRRYEPRPPTTYTTKPGTPGPRTPLPAATGTPPVKATGAPGSGSGSGGPAPPRQLTDDEKWQQAQDALRKQQAAATATPRNTLAELYPTPEAAIGQVEGRAQVVGKVETENPALRAQGFTKTWYVVDSAGVQWTVHHNPRTGRFTGAHHSGSNY
ncbi:eCIS core domain-containing protein [Streptomyces swartbergensis]|uniref:eCIS core domain-containing protein n=1 Tax=Streptomyces swartbergensis TaxID=487165 RepID=UPI0037FE9EBE